MTWKFWEEWISPLPFQVTSILFFTGFYWSEVDYSEINKPLDKLSELMRGGLSQEEFWGTDLY